MKTHEALTVRRHLRLAAAYRTNTFDTAEKALEVYYAQRPVSRNRLAVYHYELACHYTRQALHSEAARKVAAKVV